MKLGGFFDIDSKSKEIINLRLTSSGHWREPAQLERIDPQLIKMLIAYEDKRFWHHHAQNHIKTVVANPKFKPGAKRGSLTLVFYGDCETPPLYITMHTADRDAQTHVKTCGCTSKVQAWCTCWDPCPCILR